MKLVRAGLLTTAIACSTSTSLGAEVGPTPAQNCIDERRHASLVDTYDAAREDRLFPSPLPIIAIFGRNRQSIAFAGVVHSSDEASPTFRAIDIAFAEARPRAVMLEGFPTTWGPNPARITSQAKKPNVGNSYSVGEDMYAARLALKANANIWGSEPTDGELADELLKAGFRRRDIFFAAMFGPLAQDLEVKEFSGPSDPRFDKAYSRWAERNAPAYDPSVPRNSSAFRAWFKSQYGRDLENDPDWSTRGGPGQKGLAGEIARASNRIRDQHMVAEALTLACREGPILVVVGRSHLSSEWRALRNSLGEPRLISVDRSKHISADR